MLLSNRKCFLVVMGCATLLVFSSCVTLPKMATLEPLPEYPQDAGGWQTSETCVLAAEGAHVPVAEIAERMGAEGYTVSLPPPGYLTRQQRLSVNKAFVVETYYAAPMNFSDGSCVESKIRVTIHDTASLSKSGPFEARARSITQPVNLKSVPGGKELLKALKSDPTKVSEVPELLGKDPTTTTAFMKDNKIYITEGNVFDMLMNNLFCQPEVRLALAPAP